MRDFVSVGALADFQDGAGRMVEVDGRQVAVFRLGGELFALDNLCLHQGGPLCDGFIDEQIVTCPWHGWSYEIKTGTLVQDPRVALSRHDIRVTGDRVEVRLAD